MWDSQEHGQAQLRKVLNIIFPPSYVQLYHKPPNSLCSLLDLSSSYTCNHQFGEENLEREAIYEVSTEPSCRESIIALRDQLDSSLNEHQAKPVGLCPIRRAIYNQCFGEPI